MPRDYKIYIGDILNSIEKIERYTKDIKLEDFEKDELLQDGVARNLEIIGEAVKNIPEEIKAKKIDIEWKKIAGLRDILIHSYFGIDTAIIWDIIKNKIPDLKNAIIYLLNNGT